MFLEFCINLIFHCKLELLLYDKTIISEGEEDRTLHVCTHR